MAKRIIIRGVSNVNDILIASTSGALETDCDPNCANEIYVKRSSDDTTGVYKGYIELIRSPSGIQYESSVVIQIFWTNDNSGSITEEKRNRAVPQEIVFICDDPRNYAGATWVVGGTTTLTVGNAVAFDINENNLSINCSRKDIGSSQTGDTITGIRIGGRYVNREIVPGTGSEELGSYKHKIPWYSRDSLTKSDNRKYCIVKGKQHLRMYVEKNITDQQGYYSYEADGSWDGRLQRFREKEYTTAGNLYKNVHYHTFYFTKPTSALQPAYYVVIEWKGWFDEQIGCIWVVDGDAEQFLDITAWWQAGWEEAQTDIANGNLTNYAVKYSVHAMYPGGPNPAFKTARDSVKTDKNAPVGKVIEDWGSWKVFDYSAGEVDPLKIRYFDEDGTTKLKDRVSREYLENATVWPGDIIKMPSGGAILGFNTTKYKIDGWYSRNDDAASPSWSSSTTIADGGSFTANNNYSFKLKKSLKQVTLTFNLNVPSGGSGGSVSPSSKQVGIGEQYGPLPTPTPYTKSGYEIIFLGWYTAASGGDPVSSTTIIGSSNVTVYAHWQEKQLYSIWIFNGTRWLRGIPWVYTGSTWSKGTAYIYNGTDWKKGGGS